MLDLVTLIEHVMKTVWEFKARDQIFSRGIIGEKTITWGLW
jgi:hypothetical protein